MSGDGRLRRADVGTYGCASRLVDADAAATRDLNDVLGEFACVGDPPRTSLPRVDVERTAQFDGCDAGPAQLVGIAHGVVQLQAGACDASAVGVGADAAD